MKKMLVVLTVLFLSIPFAACAVAETRFWPTAAAVPDANRFTITATNYLEELVGVRDQKISFAYVNGQMFDLDQPVGVVVLPVDINTASEVIGNYHLNSEVHSSVYWDRNRNMHDLNGLAGSGKFMTLSRINNGGKAVGMVSDGAVRRYPIILDTHTFQIETIPECMEDGVSCDANDINDSGIVVGSISQGGGVSEAYAWSAGSGLKVLAGGQFATAINQKGWVVGGSGGYGGNAVLWRDLNSPPETIGVFIPQHINDRGEVIGYGGPAFYFWDGSNSHLVDDLIDRDPYSWKRPVRVSGLTNHGELVGSWISDQGGRVGFSKKNFILRPQILERVTWGPMDPQPFPTLEPVPPEQPAGQWKEMKK